MTNEAAVYVANLGKYNEGELVGEWFTFPLDFEEIAEAIGLNEVYEEYAIHDYENCPFDVSEYSSIDGLNRKWEAIAQLDGYEREAVAEAVKMGIYAELEDAVQGYNDGEFMFYHNCHNMADVAEQWLEETGGLNAIPQNLRYYFDYEAYGRDMEIEGTFFYLGNGIYCQVWN